MKPIKCSFTNNCLMLNNDKKESKFHNFYGSSNIHLLYNSVAKSRNQDCSSSYNSKSLNNNDCVFEFKRLPKDEFMFQIDETIFHDKEYIAFSFATEVEYKENSKYTHYKLEIKDTILLILGYLSSSRRNSQSTKSSLVNLDCNIMNTSTTFGHKQEDYDHPIAVLDFNFITASMTLIKEEMEIRIYVLGTSKVFFMRVNNKERYDKLAYAISIAISTSKGAHSNLMSVSLRNNWHKNYFIGNYQFMKRAKTGDMLLFRGLECPATGQRVLTCDEYDHVVLLQKKGTLLFLFEATSNEGCKLKEWIEFTGLLWNLVHEKVVYRELIIDSPNKENIQQTLDAKAEKFIQETHKKNYSISLCTIICGGKKLKHEERNEWNKSKGFSCSSLLSAAYLFMGIMPYIKESGSFVPGEFSDKAKMEFNHPFKLGPEIVIDFTR